MCPRAPEVNLALWTFRKNERVFINKKVAFKIGLLKLQFSQTMHARTYAHTKIEFLCINVQITWS